MKKRYIQLTLQEREKIFALRVRGKTTTEIAGILGRNKSTISRELRRNRAPTYNRYAAYSAHKRSQLRNSHRGRRPKLTNKKLRRYVVKMLLKEQWSPEIIASQITKKFPGQQISHETIYKFIYMPEIPNAGILSKPWRGNTADAYGADIPAGIARHIFRRGDPLKSVPSKSRIANKPDTGKPTPWSLEKAWPRSALFSSERHDTSNLPDLNENQPVFCVQRSTVASDVSPDICAGRSLTITAPRTPSIYLSTSGSAQNLFSVSRIIVMRKAVLSRSSACSVAGFPRVATSQRSHANS